MDIRLSFGEGFWYKPPNVQYVGPETVCAPMWGNFRETLLILQLDSKENWMRARTPKITSDLTLSQKGQNKHLQDTCSKKPKIDIILEPGRSEKKLTRINKSIYKAISLYLRVISLYLRVGGVAIVGSRLIKTWMQRLQFLDCNQFSIV